MIEIFKELDPEKTIISIPKKLADNIKQKIKNTDFKSVSEFNTFLLRLTLAETDDLKISDKKEAKIKEKLKKLGYL